MNLSRSAGTSCAADRPRRQRRREILRRVLQRCGRSAEPLRHRLQSRFEQSLPRLLGADQQRAVLRLRALEVAVLLARDREPHLGLERLRLEAQQAAVSLPRRLVDDTVLQHDQRARVAAETPRRFAEQPRRLLEGVGRLRVVAHAQIDRRQHVPAATVLGIGTQVRLNSRHEIGGGRLVGRRIEAGGVGAGSELRRADREIQRYANDRQRRGGIHGGLACARDAGAGRAPSLRCFTCVR